MTKFHRQTSPFKYWGYVAGLGLSLLPVNTALATMVSDQTQPGRSVLPKPHSSQGLGSAPIAALTGAASTPAFPRPSSRLVEIEAVAPIVPLQTFVQAQKASRRAQDLALFGRPSETGVSYAIDAVTLPDYQPAQVLPGPALTQLMGPPFATAQTLDSSPDPGRSRPPIDPELGVLRVQVKSPTLPDRELGRLRLESSTSNPLGGRSELGDLILEPIPSERLPAPLPPPPPTPKRPSVFLLGRVDYFKSDNVSYSIANREADGLVRSGLTLFYAPALGKTTYLITSIDGNLIRYGKESDLNYNELRFRAGIWQQLSPTMFGEIGWSNQQLFTAKEGLQDVLAGNQFFSDHSVRLELTRSDTLSSRLTLSTFYQLRMSFAKPAERSRLINTFVSSLSYSLSPSSLVAFDYQYSWSHFMHESRDDHYHQVLARFTYTFTPQTQLNLFGGYSFGRSTEQTIDYNSFIFGLGLSFNLPLF